MVLSVEHGGCESTHFLDELGLPGLRISESQVEAKTRAVLVEEYGDDRFLWGMQSPYIDSNEEAMKQAGKSPIEVRRLVAGKLFRLGGLHSAHVRDDNCRYLQGSQSQMMMVDVDSIDRSVVAMQVPRDFAATIW